MSTASLKVRLLLDLVNRLSGPAGKAQKSLRDVREEAKGLNRAKGGEQIARDLERARQAAARAQREVRALKRELRDASKAGSALNIVAMGNMKKAQKAGAQGGPGAAGGLAAMAGNARLMGGLAVAYGGYRAGQTVKKELDFGRLMFELEKATDETGEALAKREAAIRRMALLTGKTKEDLASIMTNAAFSDRPKEDLNRFTEYAAGAMNAWGTSAEDTGQALAEIGNIYKANQARIEEIGDSVNTLADKSASRETDLLQFLRTSGEQARLMGMSAEQTLAFGAALKERGVRTDVASTGFKALLTKLSTFDLEDEGLTGGIKAAGLDPKKFKQALAKDATGAIVTLLKGLDKIKDPLKRMEAFKGIGGLEYADDFSSLAGAIDRLQELLGVVSNKANYAGSTMQQAATAATKEFNKVDRSMRAIEEAGSRIGAALIGPLGIVAQKFNDIALAADQAKEASESMARSEDGIAKKLAADENLTQAERRQIESDPALRARVIRGANSRRSQADFDATQQRMDGASTPEAALRERGRLLARQLDRQIETLLASMAASPGGGSMGDRKRLEALRRQRADMPSNTLEGDLPNGRSGLQRQGDHGNSEKQARGEARLAAIRAQIDALTARMHRLDGLAQAFGNTKAGRDFAADAHDARRRRDNATFGIAPGSRFGFGRGGAPGGGAMPATGSGLSMFGLGTGVSGWAKRARAAFEVDLGEAGMSITDRMAAGLTGGEGKVTSAAAQLSDGVTSRLAQADGAEAGRQVAQTYADGIRSGEGAAVAAAQALAGKVRGVLSGAGAGTQTASAVRSRVSGALNDGVA
jgi:TP901 family phage tail tape measure protein